MAASARPAQGFFDALRPMKLTYRLRGPGPTDLRLDIIDNASGQVVQTLYRQDAASGVTERVAWDGLGADGRAATGELRFELRGVAGEPIRAASRLRSATVFTMRGFIFPLPASHSYGDGLGAGRNHGGQDLAAPCSKALLAARGGRVRVADYEAGGAGNFLVINARASRLDLVYMHMETPALVADGERVRTGQLVGRVGSTGRSTGCHLHFELWSGPWAAGGSRTDPAPFLRRWDSYS